MRWHIMQHDYKLLCFLSVSCHVGRWAAERVVLVNVCIVPECVAVFMREVVWAIQRPDSWFAEIMPMFRGNAILFIIIH